jgi:hypothetical protein
MVHFFGIFDPGKFRRAPADEAPAKASFFGGARQPELVAAPMSRAEQDLCFLYGLAPEPVTDLPKVDFDMGTAR